MIFVFGWRRWAVKKLIYWKHRNFIILFNVCYTKCFTSWIARSFKKLSDLYAFNKLALRHFWENFLWSVNYFFIFDSDNETFPTLARATTKYQANQQLTLQLAKDGYELDQVPDNEQIDLVPPSSTSIQACACCKISDTSCIISWCFSSAFSRVVESQFH